MVYFKEISIPSWGIIQSFCIEKWNGEFKSAHVFTGDELCYISDLILNDLKTVHSITATVKSAVLFINKPGYVQGMHVDGFRLDRAGASNSALNLPILNCNESPMYWYDGAYQLSKSDTSAIDYLKINWQSTPTLVATQVINVPTVVKIDTPHHVENKSSGPRLMLSIRFETDLPVG